MSMKIFMSRAIT